MRFVARFLASGIFGLVAIVSIAVADPPDSCCVNPVLPKHVRTLSGLAPAGWRVEIEERGTLNDRNAVALVLQQTNPAYIDKKRGVDTNPRLLAVALSNPDGSFDLVLQNNTLIPRPTDGRDDGYELGRNVGKSRQKALEFKHGALRINLNHDIYVGPSAGAFHTYTFRLREGAFELIGYDYTGIGTRGGELMESYNFLAHKKSSTRGNGCVGRVEDIKRNCRFKTNWSIIPPHPLLKIEEIGDGQLFSPESDK